MLTLMINGKPMEIATASATLADVVTRMGLEGKRIAIERNGEIVPRSRYATTSVASGDRLEIVGAVGGVEPRRRFMPAARTRVGPPSHGGAPLAGVKCRA